MNPLHMFKLNSKLAAEVATLNASNADLTDAKLTLEALLKQSRHYGDLQLALRQKADRRRMAAESERDALQAKLVAMTDSRTYILNAKRELECRFDNSVSEQNRAWQLLADADTQLAKIAALGTVGMSATVAKAVVLAGGKDIRVKVDRTKVLAVAARMKAQTAAVQVQF